MMTTSNKEDRLITKKDLLHSACNIGALGMEYSWNYPRQMHLAFCLMINPMLKKVYKDDPEGYAEALTRHVAFFNITPQLAPFVGGIAISMEERVAKGELEGAAVDSVKEYERMKELVKNKIVSDKDFAQTEQSYENARLSYEALSKNHSAIGQSITAPIAGYVKSILVKEGDYVTIGQPLVSVTQNRHLFLRAEVSEKYYPYLRTISSANFQTPYNNQVYELKTLNGKLLSFGKAAGDNSFYVPVTFEFDNKGEVIPGSFVEVFLLSSTMENVLSLPRTALTEEQGIFFIYLQLDEEGYKKQEVTLGADNGKSVQILTGVKAGDRVVTEGAYQVRLASASNAIPAHSHEH